MGITNTTTSMAKKAGKAFSTGDNQACSNRESGEDRGSNGAFSTEGRFCSKEAICHGCG